eukprot:2034020-Rhodomonas_salina.1
MRATRSCTACDSDSETQPDRDSEPRRLGTVIMMILVTVPAFKLPVASAQPEAQRRPDSLDLT